MKLYSPVSQMFAEQMPRFLDLCDALLNKLSREHFTYDDVVLFQRQFQAFMGIISRYKDSLGDLKQYQDNELSNEGMRSIQYGLPSKRHDLMKIVSDIKFQLAHTVSLIQLDCEEQFHKRFDNSQGATKEQSTVTLFSKR